MLNQGIEKWQNVKYVENQYSLGAMWAIQIKEHPKCGDQISKKLECRKTTGLYEKMYVQDA